MAVVSPEANGTASQRARSGTFVAVVGPSGVGKDSVIAAAREELGGRNHFVFVRRLITRPVDASEPYQSITEAEFERGLKNNAFVLSWKANNLSYALPGGVLDDLKEGRIVVANLSRDSVPKARSLFSSTLVVHITAHVETLRHRISHRGRETAEEGELRIARSLVLEQSLRADIRISNDGPLEEAVGQFVSILKSLAK